METKSHYETDFYSWTQEQAELLKSKKLAELDFENLIEEIETMGRSEKRELKSRLRVLLMHLLKWQYQPEHQCKSWRFTIYTQRNDVLEILTDSPSLKPHLLDILITIYPLAVKDAVEETGILKSNFPSECPWTFEQIIDDDFFPE